MIESHTSISIFFCILCALSSIWLFAQGVINLRSGKKTNFGLDAFWYFIDIQARKFININTPSKWNDPKRIRITGIMALFFAFALAKTAMQVLLKMK